MTLAVIDMRPINGETLSTRASDLVPARFAFWDNDRGAFVRLLSNEAWQTWEDFAFDYAACYTPPSPRITHWTLDHYRDACPDWVFEP